MSVKASIVIPTYNTREKLASNLMALESQTEESFEVIVVDDGSADSTLQYLRDFKGATRLRFASHVKNRGRAAARNTGVKLAEGEILILLDSDMVVGSDFVQTHLSLHKHEKTVVIGNVLVAPWRGKSAIARYLETRGAHRLRASAPSFKFFATANVSIRRQFFLDTGLFEEEISEYGLEDLEMGYRLFKNGAQFAYGREAVSYHNHDYQLQDVLERVGISGERSVPIILRKHPELKKTLRLDLLEPVSLRTDNPAAAMLKLVLALCLRKRVYLRVNHLVGKWTGPYLPSLVFDYLIFYNRAAGFRRAEISNQHQK